ncbi:hypothetical protein SAMN05216334_10728 [Nitrosomonas ureae]|uniref:Uncharacterized protein n=2 Tax=Nitrosomonas ureae TaxID=44577 RepID=A0A1H5UB83_9PROT|nr:hypothetical protein SAMN05216334_10728 [Nitrosomonas ureae]
MANLSQSMRLPLFIIILMTVSYPALTNESLTTPDCCRQSDAQHPNPIELPTEAIQQLKIDAGFGWGIFSGTIYNGNDHYHVTQLVVSMTPIHDHHQMHMHANMSHETKQHQINLELPPITKSALSMPLTGDDAHVHDFKWEIIRVMGYQVR